MQHEVLMDSKQSLKINLEPDDSQRLALLCGQMHANIKLIENFLTLTSRHAAINSK